MKKIDDLLDLLLHQVETLLCSEEQMTKAMPAIIAKAQHSSLRNALTHHLDLTPQQQSRLKKAWVIVQEKKGVTDELAPESQTDCKGMSGLIEEATELLAIKLAAEVTDATIISCVQKMEHYEITTYGTALAYARQLQLQKVESLLNETLQEEYDADDLLTALATAAINKEAVPEGIETENEANDDKKDETEAGSRPVKVTISERTINSPGGRAGTSHRGYGSGESRGH